MTDFEITGLTPKSANTAASLLMASLPVELHPYIPMTQFGAAAYFAEHARYSQVLKTKLVATMAGDSLAAFAYFQSLRDDASHLSYICVDPNLRRRGLAASLINYYLNSDHPRTLTLDVFSDNGGAISLYERLGFCNTGTSTWWNGPIPQHDPHVSALYISDLPQSLAVHARYGFSLVSGWFRDEPFGLGRIGNRVLKLACAEQASQADLLSSLGSLFPGAKEWLYIGTDADVPDQSHVLAQAKHMLLEQK